MISGTFIFAYLALLALICGALGILMTNGFVTWIPAFLILLFLIGLVVLAAVIIQFLFIKDIYDNKLSKLNAHTMMIDTLWQERST